MAATAAARVLIVSDTHGAIDPRIVGLASGCDFAVHAGDLGSEDVAARLAALTRLVAIRGNNDVPGKWDANEWSFLRALPAQARVELPGWFADRCSRASVRPGEDPS